MGERVRVEFEDGIADVRMVRSDKMNAVDREMFVALAEAGAQLIDDKSVRAVVLSGEGRAFCSGLDIPSLMSGGGDGGPNLLARTGESPANFAQRCAWVWQEVPVPVIAAVHGVAFGAGFQIAMGADIRIVAPDARLSLRELHWGLIPDMAVTQTLRHVVRHDVAKELTFTAREVSGTEAKELGLATHLSDDPLADATALAREIAGRNPMRSARPSSCGTRLSRAASRRVCASRRSFRARCWESRIISKPCEPTWKSASRIFPTQIDRLGP